MAEIIDIISLPIGSCPTFTVNTGGPLYVAIVQNASSAMKNCLSLSKFQAGDSLICLSAGFTLPENFVLRNAANIGFDTFYPTISVVGYDTVTSLSFNMPLFGGVSGGIQLPMSDFEFTMNGFFNASSIKNPYQIKAQFPISGINQLRVSMVNVPAALNGVVEEVGVFLKILHTLPMTV